ncbi:hypothetical protein R6M70_14515, partial [Staphylococcus aureus]
VGYSRNGKAYRIFNKRTLLVEESVHVSFDESAPYSHPTNNVNDENETSIAPMITQNLDASNLDTSNQEKENVVEDISRELLEKKFQTPPRNQDLPKEYRFVTYHPRDNIIGTPDAN